MSCFWKQRCLSVNKSRFFSQDSSPLLWSLVLGSTPLAFSGVPTVAIRGLACCTTTWPTGIFTWALPSFSRASPSSSTPPRGIAYAGTTRSTSKVMRDICRQLSFTPLSQMAQNLWTGQSLYITWRTMSFVKTWSQFYSSLNRKRSMWTFIFSQRTIFVTLLSFSWKDKIQCFW